MREMIMVGKPAPIAEVRDLSELADAWGDYLALEYAGPTRASYLKGLRVFREWLDDQGLTLATVRPPNVRAWREILAEDYAIGTVNLWLSAVRRFFAWLIEEGAPILNPAQIKGAGRNGTGRRHKRDEITAAEIRAILGTFNESPRGKRDRAIFSLMAYAALRTVETQRLDLDDLQTKDGRTVLWVTGKGHLEPDDFVVLNTKAEESLRAWLAVRRNEPGPLFYGLGRRTQRGRLSLRHIRRIIKAHYQAAGVIGERKTTHSLRHSAITNAIRNGGEPLQVQAMARHRSFDTTLGYYHEIGRTAAPAEDLIDYEQKEAA